MQAAFAITGGAALADIYQDMFEWTEDELTFWNTVINSIAVVGLTFGSLLGGKLIRKGRRRATLLIQAMAVLGSIMTMFRSLPLICLGRFIIGFVGTAACLIMGKSIGETLPASMASQYGVLIGLYINLGFLISFLVGLLVPTDPSEFAADEMWMIVSALPAIVGVISILLMSLFFVEEPVSFCIDNDNNAEAKKLLSRVYSSQKSEDFRGVIDDSEDNTLHASDLYEKKLV